MYIDICAHRHCTTYVMLNFPLLFKILKYFVLIIDRQDFLCSLMPDQVIPCPDLNHFLKPNGKLPCSIEPVLLAHTKSIDVHNVTALVKLTTQK